MKLLLWACALLAWLAVLAWLAGKPAGTGARGHLVTFPTATAEWEGFYDAWEST